MASRGPKASPKLRKQMKTIIEILNERSNSKKNTNPRPWVSNQKMLNTDFPKKKIADRPFISTVPSE